MKTSKQQRIHAESESRLKEWNPSTENNFKCCSYCKRTFGGNVISKHETICGKLFRKKHFNVWINQIYAYYFLQPATESKADGIEDCGGGGVCLRSGFCVFFGIDAFFLLEFVNVFERFWVLWLEVELTEEITFDTEVSIAEGGRRECMRSFCPDLCLLFNHLITR